MRFFCLQILAAALCMLLGGCGYHVARYGEGHLVSGSKEVGISLFTNKSYRQNLEAILTAALVDEFARRSGGKVVADDAAQLLLSGAVESYGSAAISYTSLDLIREYKVSMTVAATLREKATQKVLWKGEVVETATYPSFADVAQQQNAEDEAIREICRKLAQRIYQKVNEDF